VQEITIWQQACFAEFVARVDAHLEHEEQQENSGDLKEAPDINQVSKPRPTKRESDRRKQSKQRAIDQVRIFHLHQHQRCFHSFAYDHEERKQEHTHNCRDARALPGHGSQFLAHALLNFRTVAPHVNHESSDHHHRDCAKYCFAQCLIRKELADVASDKSAEHALHDRIIDAFVEQVGESAAGREGQGNRDEDGRGQPLLS